MVDYFRIIQKYISPDSQLYKIYLTHVILVTNKALKTARSLSLSSDQLQFIEEASMLHDIGIVKVKYDLVETTGDLPYICHGSEGKTLLEAEGLPRHALVAERHTGVGISLVEIKKRSLPIPNHDMIPETIEEKIISYADLFFSKRPESLWQEESVESIINELAQFGQDKVTTFQTWQKELGVV